MTFLKNCWQVAAFPGEIVADRLLRRQVSGDWVVLYRLRGNRLVALEDRCPHRSLPLSRGALIGDTLRCGYHGLEFAADGVCTRIPGQSQIPSNARARSFPLIERYRLIWIWMGEADQADPTLIPDVHWMDDPAWDVVQGYYSIAANYRLLTDNLLDLSHETYVHQATIGNEAIVEAPAAATVEGGAVMVRREIANCNPPPFFQLLARVTADTDVRRWQRTEYRPPGYCVIDVGVEVLSATQGADRAEGRVINLITPASEITSHYFWAFARNCRLNEPEVSDVLRSKIGSTFDEDKEVLELQQLNLGSGERDPSYKVAIKADLGVMLGRRICNAALDEERGRGTERSAPSPIAASL